VVVIGNEWLDNADINKQHTSLDVLELKIYALLAPRRSTYGSTLRVPHSRRTSACWSRRYSGR